MRERRQHARYDVSHLANLKGCTQNGPLGERLVTMSAGGCGFWSPLEGFSRRIGDKLEVELHWGLKPQKSIQVKAEILYVSPQPFEGQIGRFYGLRFQNEQVALLQEIMTGLGELYHQGKLKMAR